MIHDVGVEVAGWWAVEFEGGGLAGQGLAGFVEAGDSVEGVSAGGGDEADFRVLLFGEAEEEVIEFVSVFGVGVEASAADGEDGG